MDFPLSAEQLKQYNEMAASAGMTLIDKWGKPLTNPQSMQETENLIENPFNKKNKKVIELVSKFKYRQYMAFSCPGLLVYWQGVHPISHLDSLDLNTMMLYTSARNQGRGRGPEPSDNAQILISSFIENNSGFRLYADKPFHVEFIQELQEAGVKLNKNKVANRKIAEETLNIYLNDMSDFLAAKGYETPEAYLLDHPRSDDRAEEPIGPVDWSTIMDDL